MTAIIQTATDGPARIGYRNLFDSATTITATDEAAGFEKENAFNWNLFDWWKPASTGTKYLKAAFASAVTANYFGVFGHNLHTYSDTVKLQYSTDDISWSDATTAQAPATGKVIFVTFSDITAKYWRIEYITTGPGTLGACSFGEVLELPQFMDIGFAPPTLIRNNKYTDKSTVKGVPLPRSIERMPGKITIMQTLADPVWMRSDWIPFIDHAETKPFFFSWDSDSHAGETGFCRTLKDPTATYSHALFMQGTIQASVLTVLDP